MHKSLWKQTRAEKIGSIDGFNLFFGALLGANLGTLGEVPLGDYIKLIGLLAGTVAILRMVSTSDRRGYALVMLATYVVLIVLILVDQDLRPEGMSLADLQRLGVTLAVWIIAVLALEFAPTHADDSEVPAGARGPDQA